MNLKQLKSYMDFNHAEFLKGKTTVLISIKFDDKKSELKGEMVILKDDTGANEYAKIGFHIPNKSALDLSKYELKKPYKFVGIEKCSVYGDFSDNLSITCKDIVLDGPISKN